MNTKPIIVVLHKGQVVFASEMLVKKTESASQNCCVDVSGQPFAGQMANEPIHEIVLVSQTAICDSYSPNLATTQKAKPLFLVCH